MKRPIMLTALTASLMLTACQKSAEGAPAQAEKTDATEALAFDVTGAGPLKLGTSFADVAAAYPVTLDYSSELDSQDPKAKPTGKGCEQVSIPSQFPGVSLMFEDGRLTRIDGFADLGEGQPKSMAMTLTLGHTTVSPFAETKTSLLAKTGKLLTVEPHKYSETGHYLEFLPKDGKTGAVIESEGDAIAQIRVGELPAVQYVEGCL